MDIFTPKLSATGVKTKHLYFVLFILALISLHLFLQQSNILTHPIVQEVINNTGYLRPVLFIIAYAFGICMFLPAIFFSGIGAMSFGLIFGFFYNMAGAMLGASMAFFIGRYFGQNLFSKIIANHMGKYKNKIITAGFIETFYLRLACFPFTPLSFGMGATQVKFSQYFWGTFFGKFASGFIITFFFATLKEVIISGSFGQIFQWKSLLACLLFIGSFYMPKLLRILNLYTGLKDDV